MCLNIIAVYLGAHCETTVTLTNFESDLNNTCGLTWALETIIPT